MRHKTPAVVQHGSKATPPLVDNVMYDGANVLVCEILYLCWKGSVFKDEILDLNYSVLFQDEQSLCEESGGIKMDGDEVMVTVSWT